MPTKPKVPCAYSGCPNLVISGYCEEHKKKRNEDYNKYERDKFSKTFYNSKLWKAVRKKHLVLEPFCRECIKEGRVVKAVIVDHVVPIKKGGAKYDEENLQSLCWNCHSRKSIEEGSRFGTKPKN